MTREEKIAELINIRDNFNYTLAPREVFDDAIKALKQDPKTGHWIENAPEYQNIDPPYICSECGNAHLIKTNYCDQCGAKMESGVKE